MIEELTIEASHRCQLNCCFCSSKNTIFKIKPDSALSLGEIKKAVEKFKPKIVRWSGGEPFLYLNKKIIREIGLYPFVRKQIVTTNGILFAKILRLADDFAEIRISIYGGEKRHDALTKTRGSWAKAIRTVRALLEKKINIFLTAPYLSAVQIQEVNDLAKSFGIGVRITGLVPTRFLKIRKEARGFVCSLGGEGCCYYQKRLILPDGKIIHCAVEKASFRCPHRNY